MSQTEPQAGTQAHTDGELSNRLSPGQTALWGH
jgi:hypothetical protein